MKGLTVLIRSLFNLITCVLVVGVAFSSSLIAAEQSLSSNLLKRSPLANSRITFEQSGQGHVAFMGGSITEMEGYRAMVGNDLEKRFPETEFKFTNAGISSTCSTTGAFRVHRDVITQGNVDLFFVEFAVNDDQDGAHTLQECVRGLEGIVRQIRRHNPFADIIVTYFVNEKMLAQTQQGERPVSVDAHERVAEQYAISSVNVQQELASRIESGKMTWKIYGGTHPSPAGHRFTADLIKELLETAWSEPLKPGAQKVAYRKPKPLDSHSYQYGRFIKPDVATKLNDFEYHPPDWKSLPGSSRKRYEGFPLLCAETVGASCELPFTGTAIGAFLLAGPDAGQLEVRVDEGEWQTVELYHRYSRGLHYPRTVMFAEELPPGTHRLELKVAESNHTKSQGHAVRIMEFTVNGEAGE